MRNKLTKIGFSALCGSLAAIGTAANAGDISVTGSAVMTHTQVDGDVTGNPLGMKSNLSFIGEGELDGGQAVKLTIANTDQNVYSAAQIDLTTNSLGTFTFSQANGGGIGSYDDNMPRAWEEVWDTGIATSINLEKGVGSSTHLNWASPAGPAGTQIKLAWAPDNDGAAVNDKSASGAPGSNIYSNGYDIVLDIAPDSPINLFAGYSLTEQEQKRNAVDGDQDLAGDVEEAVIGLKLKFGPLSLGGQASGAAFRPQATEKTDFYANSSWGVAINVNDNLSISYGEARSAKAVRFVGTCIDGKDSLCHFQNSRTAAKNKRMGGDSIQLAYTMGGLGIKFADTDWENAGYGEDSSKSARTIALSLAF